jgi:hypothetical protein
MHDDDDLVDLRCCIHGRHRVLEDRFTGDLEELLRDVQTDSGTSATRQDNADCPQRRVVIRHAKSRTHMRRETRR